MEKDIRWKQRFENFEKAYLFLEKSTQKESYNDLEVAGLAQAFEFTFELAWKTLKDYLEFIGINALGPRGAIKEAFSNELIEDGHLWIKMLEKRNELSHTYNEEQVKRTITIICDEYFPGIHQVYSKLKSLV